ncbi:MAG: MBL fold metallo-hydrolase [Promethearchaeota archaeon]
MTSIQIFDGIDTIGGNKIYLEEKGKGILLDFGMNFKKYGDFFHQFMSPRSIRGIYDLINLKLIPKLNIYREDLIPTDLDISSYPSLNVEAILLSHAHMDHCGNIGLLKQQYPIIASPSTIMLLKSMLDSVSTSMLGSDVAYYSPKRTKEDGRILETDRRIDIGRNFICTENYSNSFSDFLTKSTKSKKIFEEGILNVLSNFTSNFKIEAYEVDHSIYGATAYIISGDTIIAYTGDFRLHGKKGKKSEQFIKKAKEASVLIIEGTRAAREDVNESEEIVFENCLRTAEEAKGLIIADFTARNFERLEMFKKIAEKIGRQLIITLKDAYLLNALENANEDVNLNNLTMYRDLKQVYKGWEKYIMNDDRKIDYIDPVHISKEPEKFICCFSLYDVKNLLDINIRKGTYIYSSSEAFEEESEFDFICLKRWLDFFEFEVVGFDVIKEVNKIKPIFEKGFHASGHLSKSDLIRSIEIIDPDILIPVHTDSPDWFYQTFDNTLRMESNKSYNV